MFMDMDFPHPRQAERNGLRKADYVTLVASATSRQATSRTVSALLSTPREQAGDVDILGSRIAFFARTGRYDASGAHGAFWMSGQDQCPPIIEKFELPINLADSADRNSNQSYTVNPDVQVTERGTEL
jgi:hypothetical protein